MLAPARNAAQQASDYRLRVIAQQSGGQVSQVGRCARRMIRRGGNDRRQLLKRTGQQ
jgi:hypothetical protein